MSCVVCAVMRVLTQVCVSCVSELIYKASSPDEEALCRAAKDNGIVFISRSTQSITVQVNGDKLVYEVLCSMEFTSDRRRMSVVVRTPEGELKLLTKGADTMMYSRLGDGGDELKEKTLQDLDVFSKEVKTARHARYDTRTHTHDTHDTHTHTHTHTHTTHTHNTHARTHGAHGREVDLCCGECAGIAYAGLRRKEADRTGMRDIPRTVQRGRHPHGRPRGSCTCLSALHGARAHTTHTRHTHDTHDTHGTHGTP